MKPVVGQIGGQGGFICDRQVWRCGEMVAAKICRGVSYNEESIFDLIYGVSRDIADTCSRTKLAPGVDGVDSHEVEDMFAGVWGDEGEERAALEAEAGESRGPGRGVKGFG